MRATVIIILINCIIYITSSFTGLLLPDLRRKLLKPTLSHSIWDISRYEGSVQDSRCLTLVSNSWVWAHWLYLNTAILSGQIQAIFFFSCWQSRPLSANLCKSAQISPKWDHMAFLSPFLRATSYSYLSPSHSCSFLAFLSFTFNFSFELFFFKSLHSVFSESFPSALFTTAPTPSSQLLLCTDMQHMVRWHAQPSVCVCACVCVRNEREKLFGNHFVSDLSKPCGSSMPCFSACWSFWFSKLSVKTVIWAYGKLNASVTSCCLFSVEVCVSVLLNFFSPCLCNVTETDDYAEIVDEEDTYTMPSSKYLQPSPSQFIRTNLNLRCCICYPAAKES